MASGEWLIFAGADDIFDECAFDVIDEYYKCGSDIVYFKPYAKQENGAVSDRANKYIKLCDNYKESDSESVWQLKLNYVVPWSKMFKREFIIKNNVYFECVKYSNDVYFAVLAAIKARDITVSNNQIYCVTQSSGTLTNIKSKDSLMCRLSVVLRVIAIIRGIGLPKYQYTTIEYCGLAFKF